MPAKPVLLTVDDEAEVLRAVARDLRKQYGKDYQILRADSGASALETLKQLRERQTPVALVLSDHRMPEMHGVELLAETRQVHPDAKRVLLTAYTDSQAAIDAINESHLDYYLLKPWDPPEERLYPVLDDLLADWRSQFRPGYSGARVVGTRWSAAAHEMRDFLARNLVPYQFLDLESSPEGEKLAAGGQLPVVVLEDGSRLEAPSLGDLGQALGLQQEPDKSFYQVAITGAGPAGLATAVYAASEGLSCVLLDREAPGGQAGTSSRIENYLGFPAGLSGADLTRRAVAQARRFEVEILTPVEVESLRLEGPYKHLRLTDGTEVTSHALMIATGVSWRRLTVPGAEALTGQGVYYGAAISEAIHCKDEIVYTMGAGNSAGQAALYFAQYAHKVVMLVRGDALGEKMSQYLVERIESSELIEVRLNAEIEACHGEEHLKSLTIKDTESGKEEEVPAQLLFIFIGAVPRTDWLEGVVARDSRGFLFTGPDLTPEHLNGWPLRRAPYLLETCVPGVFAAGDVRSGSVKRVASAVGEGSVAVHFMHRHLASL